MLTCSMPGDEPRVDAIWVRDIRQSVFCWPGGHSGGIPPDPIPNSAVKAPSAHGTACQHAGESVAARPAKNGYANPALTLNNEAPCEKSRGVFVSAGPRKVDCRLSGCPLAS